MSIEAKQATPHSVLIEQLMDSRIPKTEREHAARREIEMLREALRLPAQQAETPVAWMYDFLNSDNREEVIRDWMTQDYAEIEREKGFNVRPLYTAPRQWVGLTDEEMNTSYRQAFGLIDSRMVGDQVKFVRAIEAKLKEKNT
jgi:hypothetical protein